MGHAKSERPSRRRGLECLCEQQPPPPPASWFGCYAVTRVAPDL
jgi:hypothetical protein